MLIVGLGNPGIKYAHNRHNVGAWLVEALARQAGQTLRVESKFHSLITKANIAGHSCYIAQPTTYMNESGRAIAAIMKFYKFTPEQLLVAHDELDFDAGMIRLKEGGGHGGHNGLRDTISAIGSRDFYRVRIGIGHPGDKSRVHNYVLSDPSRSDTDKIQQAIDEVLAWMPEILGGHIQQAMKALHTD